MMLKLSIDMQKAQIKFSTNFIDNLISENGEFMTLLTESNLVQSNFVQSCNRCKNLFANPATDPKTINLQNSIAEIKKSVITYINNMYQNIDLLDNNSESMSSHESDFHPDNIPALDFQPDNMDDNMDDNIDDIQIQTRKKSKKRKLSDSDIQIQTRQKSKKRKLNHKEKKSKQKKKKWRKQLEKTKKKKKKKIN
eukprot:24836_1